MATAKGGAVKMDKKLHGRLLHKLSKMLTKTDFRKLKHLFYTNDQVARTDIDEIDDVFLFLALLERHDYVSVGRYDVLIEHLETLELNECNRVIKEHTEEIEEYRKTQGQGGPITRATDEELFDARQRQMMEELVDKKLKQFRVGENQNSITVQTREAQPREPTRTQARYVTPPSDAEVNKRDKDGMTPLMRAAKDVARVRSLIQAGADIDMRGGEFDNTALIYASINGHKEVVVELINAGADVNIKNKLDNTALAFASMYGHKEVVVELINAGADVNIKGKFDYTALIHASRCGHKEVVVELVNAGADVNIKDEAGRTALFLAEVQRDTKIAEMLRNAGGKR